MKKIILSLFIVSTSYFCNASNLQSCNELYKEKKYNDFINSCIKLSAIYPSLSWNLAQVYYNGLNGDIDKQKGDFYAEEAASKGIKDANILLCDSYSKSTNHDKAFWYCNQASSYNENSKLTLASLYANGIGIKKDSLKAQNIYEELSEKNNTEAQFLLSKVYLTNDKQSPDGLFWLRSSFKKGNQQAKIYVDYLENTSQNCNYLKSYFNSNISLFDAINSCSQISYESSTSFNNNLIAKQGNNVNWQAEMSNRLKRIAPNNPMIQDNFMRNSLLTIIKEESKKANLDPQLVLSMMNVLSNFKKYEVSNNGDIGIMQVNQYWIKTIGQPEQDLFALRTNIRFGCTIFRYYLQLEHNDIAMALMRYSNGSSTNRSEFAKSVLKDYQKNWQI